MTGKDLSGRKFQSVVLDLQVLPKGAGYGPVLERRNFIRCSKKVVEKSVPPAIAGGSVLAVSAPRDSTGMHSGRIKAAATTHVAPAAQVVLLLQPGLHTFEEGAFVVFVIDIGDGSQFFE